MMKNVLPLLLLLLTIGGCMSEEKFETRSGDELQFSTDTVRFDTVLAGYGTRTNYFMVYNRNDNGISISNVSFAGGDAKGFRVNVDGMYINDGLSQPIDCRKNDSLRVFVELTPEAFDRDNPVEIIAQLIFTLSNGKSQHVTLSAFSQNVIVMRAPVFYSDSTLSAHRPYLIFDSLQVAEGATMTLKEGVQLYFYDKSKMIVAGTLVAEGTREQPVVMRGHRTDYMFPGQPYDRVPNQWDGLRFKKTSFGNRLNYCDIHSGTDGIVCDSSGVEIEKLRIENSVVHNMGGYCLKLFQSRVFVGNSQISNAFANCVALYGGEADFIHCTIAQFYPFDALRGAALIIGNEYSGYGYPVSKALFRNCLITGYSEDEIFINQSETYPDLALNWGFQNCLLDTPAVTDDENIVNCAWDNKSQAVCREKNFPAFNSDELIYNFPLVENSPAVGLGSTTLTGIYYPEDRLGRMRLNDGQSDAGCYEYYPKAE